MKPAQLNYVEPSTKYFHMNSEEQHGAVYLPPNKNLDINAEEQEDIIYEDVSHCDMGNEVEVVKSQNVQLHEHLNLLHQDIENFSKKLTKVKSLSQAQLNLYSLYTSARAEIKRKDQTILDLRRQLDDITFKRQRKRKKNEEFVYVQHKRNKFEVEGTVKDNKENNLHSRNYLTNKERSADKKTEHENVGRRENNKYSRDYSSTSEGDRKTEDSEDHINENRETSRSSRGPMNRERDLNYNERRIGCDEDASKENADRTTEYDMTNTSNFYCSSSECDRCTDRRNQNIWINERKIAYFYKRKREWSEDRLKNVVKVYENKEMGVNAAAKAFGTLKTTLKIPLGTYMDEVFRSQEDSGNLSPQDHSDNCRTTVDEKKVDCTSKVEKLDHTAVNSSSTPQSTLHLTLYAETSWLHIEETHLNNLTVHDGMKTDDSIIMNISNKNCELAKFKSSGESISENQNVCENNQFTFANFMEKITSTSTPSKLKQTNVSNKSKDTAIVQKTNVRRKRVASKIFFLDD